MPSSSSVMLKIPPYNPPPAPPLTYLRPHRISQTNLRCRCVLSSSEDRHEPLLISELSTFRENPNDRFLKLSPSEERFQAFLQSQLSINNKSSNANVLTSREKSDDDDDDFKSNVVGWGRVLMPFSVAGKVLTNPDYIIVCWITGNFVPVVTRKCHRWWCSSKVPYDKSVWKALELPLQCLINAMHMSFLLVPLRITDNTQAIVAFRWNAIVLSVLWFLYRWKTYFFTRGLDVLRAGGDLKSIASIEKASATISRLLGGAAFYQVIGGRWDFLLPFLLISALGAWLEQLSRRS